MKMLLLPAYFMPEKMASSHLDENKYSAFAANQIQMVCYAPQPTRGIDEVTRLQYSDIKNEILYDGMMEVHRFRLLKEGKNPISRAIRYFNCAFKQLLGGISEKDIDILYIVSTPPIQGAMGVLVKKIKKIPLVYNLQDIFPDSLVNTGLCKRNGLVWKVGRIIENFTYRNADKIIVISESFKYNIMSKGVPENKIEVIYNWVDENMVVNIEREDNILFDRYNLNRNKFYITYCGNIGLTQNMDMFLEVAISLSYIQDIHFVIIGDGVYKKDVEYMINNKQINNITLLPFQPYDEISHVFSLGDVGVVISKIGVGENSVPSKTWSIMAAERAVIASFDENELKRIIEENTCGIFTKSGDKKSLMNAIIYLHKHREECKQMGKSGRRFILQNLTKEVGVTKYVNVMKLITRK